MVKTRSFLEAALGSLFENRDCYDSDVLKGENSPWLTTYRPT